MSIKENRRQEAEARELANVEQKDIISTIPDVQKGVMKTIRDDNGRVVAVGEYKKFTKVVYCGQLGGYVAQGDTEEELEADILKHKKILAEHNNNLYQVREDFTAAENVVEAAEAEGVETDVIAAKQVEVNGVKLLISYKEKRISTTEGEEVANLSDLSSKLSNEDIETLLIQRAEAAIPEEEDCYDEDCYDEDCYDEEYDEDC